MAHPHPPALFDAASRGEHWAQEEIDRLIRSFARHVCHGRGPAGAPEADWEDVAQEASKRFFLTGIHQYRGGGSERSYLYSMVKTTVILLARAAARRRRREQTVEREEVQPPHNPIAALDVEKILGRLDAVCRQLLRRVFLEDARYAELAGELRMAESSVRAKVSRCIRSARELAA